MRKNTYSTLIAYLRVAKRKKKCKFFVTFFFCSTTFHEKNSISTILLSLSLFCLFTKTLFSFLSAFQLECFYRSGKTSETSYTHSTLCTCSEQPTLARACIAHSVRRHHFWTGLARELFRMLGEIHFSRFFLFFYVGGIITPGVMQIVREKKYHHT